MKKLIFLLVIIIFSTTIHAQYFVSVSTDLYADTAVACKGDEITFYAYGIDGTDTLDNMEFSWDFGDGTTISGLGEDTVTHKFLNPQLFRVVVRVWSGTYDAYNIFPVKLGLDPWFTGTKTDIPDTQTGICSGEIVTLTGIVNTNNWEEERQNIRNEIYPQFIDSSHPYTSYINRRSFGVGDVITSADDIDSVGIFIEHSNTANVKFILTCPSGQSVVLKDTGGVQKYFGEPVIEASDYSEGTPYWYYFNNYPDYGTINTYAGSEDTLPSGNYQPENSFAALIGCELNGNWTITVADSTNDSDNGYVFGWAIYFDENVETDTVKYHNTYDITKSFWSGGPVNYTLNGVGEAVPEDEGGHPYAFYIKDDFGCYHDTTLNVVVEKPSFQMDKESMEIGDSVQVTDLTSWTYSRKWDFGDDGDLLYGETEYKKYTDSGTYDIILVAYSETGCKDYDTMQIKVIPRSPLSVTDYNIFTPNGDGINDVFTFFNTPDELITAANIESVKGRIINRYGEIVCKWDTPEEITKGWDGTINNGGKRNVPAGFYYYVIIIEGKDGVKYDPISGYIYVYREKK